VPAAGGAALAGGRPAAGGRFVEHYNNVRLHSAIPVLPFYELKLTSIKQKNHAYPKIVKTLGDRIRQRRLDLGIFQKDVASQIGVTKGTIVLWEKNPRRTTPQPASQGDPIYRFASPNR